MTTIQLTDDFFGKIWSDIKTGGQTVIDKATGRAKEAAKQELDKIMPTSGGSGQAVTVTNEQPYVPSDVAPEEKSYTMYYVAGAAVLAFIIYKVAK